MSHMHSIATAVPPYGYAQDYAAQRMKRWVHDKTLRRMVHHVYRQSGIAQRYSVLPDFQPGAEPCLFGENAEGTLAEPTTGQRNRAFQELYPALARKALAAAMATAPWIRPADITHVVTVSCTGFCNPGPDLFVVSELGLAPSVERYHLGFMGCYAAFPALRMADQFCRANPQAVVLVLCVELCTLHLQVKPTPDSLLANALFADGAAAVLVRNDPPPNGRRSLQLESFATRIIPDSAADMAWTIGDRGFDMTLSSFVPRILGLHARAVLDDVLAGTGLAVEELAGWAVHPGGKAILQAFEKQMGWPRERGPLALSHRVLNAYGNMSSATILFLLKAIVADGAWRPGGALGALAFGPGLTVEFALLRMTGAGKAATRACDPNLKAERSGEAVPAV